MRFLIVDDDETVHMYLEKLLDSFATCDGAMSGPEALEMYKKAYEEDEPYNVIFMDIMMPEMDGHVVVKKLRDLESELGVLGTNEFKLVMITSLNDTKNVSKAFFKGFATCYIVKPFNKANVLHELRENNIL